MTPRASASAKSEVTASRGVASAHNREAAEAGLAVLEEGGTAFDAIVAMSFVTAVRESAMNGIGGGGVFLGHEAATGRTWEVEFYGRTPHDLPEDVFVPYLLGAAEDMEFGWPGTRDNVSQRGALAVGVPAHVRGLEEVHRRTGSMPWARLIEPAIRLASDGYHFDEEDVYFLAGDAPTLARHEEAARIYLPGGLAGIPTRRVRFPDLARTLTLIRDHGADGFYTGPVAEAMVGAVRSGGGFLSHRDLQEYRANVGSGLAVRYRDVDVHTSSGVLGGITLATMLRLAEEADLRSLPADSAEALDLTARIMRLAWSERFVMLADESIDESAVAGMLSDASIAALHARLGGRLPSPAADSRPAPWAEPNAHTTSIAAADAAGNVATITQTLGQCFGSCIVGPGTGALIYDLTYWLNPRPGSASSVGGWKKPPGHATPVVLTRDGAAIAALSAPGGRKIVTAMFQVILNIVDRGMGIQEAISAPRIHVEGVSPVDPTAFHGRMAVDPRIDAATVQELRRRGYEVSIEYPSAVRLPFARPVGVAVAGAELTGGVDQFGKSISLGG